MKKIWDFLRNFIIFAYILLIIFVTICLLSYNNYKVTVFGRNTLLPVIDADLEPDYVVGDLLIIQKNNLSTVKEGDVIFFYRTVAGVTTVNFAKVTEALRVNDTEVTYTVEGDYTFSSSYFIGKAETATVIPKIGNVLSLLESKWGFLFLGVFPSLVAFLYTVHSVITEIQEADDDEEEKEKKKKSNKKKTKDKKVSEVKENDFADKQDNAEKEETIPQEKTNDVSEEINQEKLETKKIETENKEDDKTTQIKQENQPETIEKEVVESKEETKEKQKEAENTTKKTLTEEQKKALIEAKMKSMTEEEKKALIEAKLKTMTEEQKRALIEAKKKKMEEEKNNK